MQKFVPTLEALEIRDVPAAVGFWNLNNLSIMGDKRDNTIILNDYQDGQGGGFLNVIIDGVFFGNLPNIYGVYFNLGDGNDRVIYTQWTNATNRYLWLGGELGNGNDVFDASLDNVTLTNSRFDFWVNGGNGNDSLFGSFASGVNGGVQPPANLDAGSSINVKLNGGNGNDNLWTYYRGELDGTANIWLDGGNGNDTIRAEHDLFPNTDGSANGRVNLRITGGNGNDNILLTAQGAADSGITFDLLIDGGKGNNTVTAPEGVPVINARRRFFN